jgi:hypothetical protein
LRGHDPTTFVPAQTATAFSGTSPLRWSALALEGAAGAAIRAAAAYAAAAALAAGTVDGALLFGVVLCLSVVAWAGCPAAVGALTAAASSRRKDAETCRADRA